MPGSHQSKATLVLSRVNLIAEEDLEVELMYWLNAGEEGQRSC